MAKSLRSKSKLAARNAKRYNPKSDYAIMQAARLHQVSSRLAAKNKHGRTVTEEEADEVEGIQGDEKMLNEEEQGAGAKSEVDADQAKGWYQRTFSRTKGDALDPEWEEDSTSNEDVSYALLGLYDPSELDTSMFEESDSPSDSESATGIALWHDANGSLEKLKWLLKANLS